MTNHHQVAPGDLEHSNAKPKSSSKRKLFYVLCIVALVAAGVTGFLLTRGGKQRTAVLHASLRGITSDSFGDKERTAFTMTVSESLSTPERIIQPMDVTIISVKDVQVSEAHSSIQQQGRQTASSSSVAVEFTVVKIELQEAQHTLAAKVVDGSFAKTLQEKATETGSESMKDVVVETIALVETDEGELSPPTSPPTAAPTAPTLGCGSTGGPGVDVPAAIEIYLLPSKVGELCILTSSIGPVARSYDGESWELLGVVGTEETRLSCTTNNNCLLMSPNIAEMQLVAIAAQNTLSTDEQISKFLTQATFGPTLDEIKSFTGSYKSWIENQLILPPSLHREYLRKRISPRVHAVSSVGSITKPCDPSTRWHSYAFTEQDNGKHMYIQPVNNGEYFQLIVDDIPRHHVLNVTEELSGLNITLSPFIICEVKEIAYAPKTLTVGPECETEINNPDIYFHVEPTDRLVATNVVLQELDPPVPRAKIFPSGPETCPTLPTGPSFVKTEVGGYYMHDARLKLVENSLESPYEGKTPGTTCHNTPINPFNSNSCILTTEACEVTQFESSFIELNATTLRDFYTVGGKFVYSINGLRTEDLDAPCKSTSSRWLIHQESCGSEATLLDSDTNNTLVSLLSQSNDPNPFVRDIIIPPDASCSNNANSIGAKLDVVSLDGTKVLCFEHVHPHLHNVYDFSQWSMYSAHPGNKEALKDGRPNPITSVAQSTSEAVLTFPSWHPQSRWDSKEDLFPLLGRLGDTVDYQALPSSVQSLAMASFVGASIDARDSDTEIPAVLCGSPGEVATAPSTGSRYGIAVTNLDEVDDVGPFDQVPDRRLGKSMVWSRMAFKAPDQLRQRMAWALSQIFVVTEEAISNYERNEAYTAYYDIFVRHGLGNYRDIIREVSYSPLMGKMLTFEGSVSYSYSASRSTIPSFPDENYAREIMQLFTIGLWELNDDGTKRLDAHGDPIPTYDNDDITELARAWTAFKRQVGRGNVENSGIPLGSNYIDPMKIVGHYRDPFPKLGLMKKYIGDGYPLCTELPNKMFLRKGATYRYLGRSYHPELQQRLEKQDVGVTRMSLKQDSKLFQALCNPDPSLNNKCRYQVSITLSDNLVCDGLECEVDTVRVVKLPLTTPYCPDQWRFEPHHEDNDHGDVCVQPETSNIQCPTGCVHNATNEDVAPYCFEMGTLETNSPKLCRLNGNEEEGVYFEYVRPACVEFPFFNNGTRIARAGNDKGMCADVKTESASSACCYKYKDRAYGTCTYAGERSTFDTAEKQCNTKYPGKDYGHCDFAYTYQKCKVEHSYGYHWSSTPCNVQSKISPDGKVSIVHQLSDNEYAWRSIIESMSPLVDLENKNWFRVVWDGEYPHATRNSCGNGACDILAGTNSQPSLCLCNTTVIDTMVFDQLPTIDQIVEHLHIGGMSPESFDVEHFTLHSSVSTELIKVYSTSQDPFTIDTVFEVAMNGGQKRYFRNIQSRVRVGEESKGMGSFRNPPSFNRLNDLSTRDAMYETDALIDHLFHHPNTAPFVARHLINRFVSSNPSTRYIRQVAQSFRTGTHDGIGTGLYGDLSATIAAVLLDREARSQVVEYDPSFGKFQEPLLKVIHFMRSMLFRAKDGGDPELDMMDLIGMMAYRAPSVFSFFQYDVSANGPIRSSSLVAPEATVSLQGPNVLGLVNSLSALVKTGLNHCGDGLRKYPPYRPLSCWRLERYWDNYDGVDNEMSQGKINYVPSADLSAEQIVEQLNLLLASGRLGEHSKQIIARELQIANETTSFVDGLKVAQQLLLVTPEFNAFGRSHGKQVPRKVQVVNDASSSSSFKAVIYVHLGGGIDSYNILVPHSGCTGEDLHAQYQERRGIIALDPSSLLQIDVADGSQPCNKFGIHPKLTALQELYNEKDALFIANMGPLLEPVTVPFPPNAKLPAALYAHNTQTKISQTIRDDVFDIGVAGRLRDELYEQGESTGSFTIAGGNSILNGNAGKSPGPDSVHRTRGVNVFDPYPISERMRATVANITKMTVSNVFGETWSQVTQYTIERSDVLNAALDAATLETEFSDGSIADQFAQAAKLMKSRNELQLSRAAFYTSIGGFDTHGDAHETLAEKMDELNSAIQSITAELKAQGLWEHVTILFGSEFGRTLTGNGQGTDHGWGGNYWAIGGPLKGGQVLGSYPDDLREGTPLDSGRGRIVPTTSWDAPWEAISQWMGVSSPAALDRILPLRNKFPNNFDYSDMFNGE